MLQPAYNNIRRFDSSNIFYLECFMMENNSAELSFRGKAIPEIMLRPSYQLADDNLVWHKNSEHS